MRYIKHLFVRSFYRCAAPARLALLCAGFAALGGCTDETDSAGGSSTADSHIPLALEITASGFTGQPDASPDTRASEQDNYDTWFEETDAIGLFAVRGIGTPAAAIVDGINNSKLTYAPAADASHKPTWQPADAATTSYYYADVTYIAYYPYKDGIVIDPTQSAVTILASFSGKTELQPAADQSTPEAYAASDLMTADGTATDTADPSRKLLSLTFTHSYSLLVLKANLTKAMYVAPAGSAFDYHPQATATSADPGAADVMIRDVKAYKIADGVFRAITKPVSDDYMRGSYSTHGMMVEYNASLAGLASLKANQRFECTVNVPLSGTADATERALQPGDYVFQHNGKIEIYPGDGPVDASGKIPDYTNAVGIVTTCIPARMTDEGCTGNGWTHAYVMGTETHGNNLRWCWQNRMLADLEDVTTITQAKDYMNGCKDTKYILSTKYNDYEIFDELVTYRNNNPLPQGVNRSPWFIPSTGQWYDLIANIGGKSPDDFNNNTTAGWNSNQDGTAILGGINARLNKIDKSLPDGVRFPCSTEPGLGAWMVRFNGNTVEFGTVDKTLKELSPLYFFAF